MALNIPPFRKRIVTVLRDAKGEELQTFETVKSRVVQPDGSIEETQTTESRALGNGRLTHPGRMAGPQAEMPLVCELCQNPPRSFNPFQFRRATHSLVSQGNDCSRCGRFTCLKHGRQNRDGVWLCIPCARKGWVLNALFGWLWEEVP